MWIIIGNFLLSVFVLHCGYFKRTTEMSDSLIGVLNTEQWIRLRRTHRCLIDHLLPICSIWNYFTCQIFVKEKLMFYHLSVVVHVKVSGVMDGERERESWRLSYCWKYMWIYEFHANVFLCSWERERDFSYTSKSEMSTQIQ